MEYMKNYIAHNGCFNPFFIDPSWVGYCTIGSDASLGAEVSH